MMSWLISAGLFLLVLSPGSKAQDTVSKMCSSDELCTSVKRCKDSEDSGLMAIGPRIYRICGDQRVCCETAQLESWDRSQSSKNRAVSSSIQDKVDESKSRYASNFKYKNCGYSDPRGLIPHNDRFNPPEDVSFFGEFPWMVAIFTVRQSFLCGGTLIHPRLVISSSHNVINELVDTLVARVGDWDLNGLNEQFPHQSRRIKEIIMHPEFDQKRLFNDIALLLLDEPIVLAPHIQPLCLPPPESPELINQLLSATCYSTGWGAKQADSDKLENVLKRLNLPVVEHDECQAMLRNTRVSNSFRLGPSFMCAGGNGKDPCKGDGGSPLFCTMPGERDRYRLLGIVSWSVECGVEDIPAVYTNVPYLRSWIDERIREFGITLQAQ
ncbi:phenoloxidase-activating factor 2-like [Drosophila takahashii]|uniref:phenoloxidase-activating factor 2-like n=1 Tax=Drosophila takahashii TaxID=29030 RepID=UPI001CF83A4B|nr:phenoloxidase-activating factor 2-like [Drosophila takahashii]XP_044251896.1 phenoloxidase-activating factor 2-like [Drosophila takahashii]